MFCIFWGPSADFFFPPFAFWRSFSFLFFWPLKCVFHFCLLATLTRSHVEPGDFFYKKGVMTECPVFFPPNPFGARQIMFANPHHSTPINSCPTNTLVLTFTLHECTSIYSHWQHALAFQRSHHSGNRKDPPPSFFVASSILSHPQWNPTHLPQVRPKVRY